MGAQARTAQKQPIYLFAVRENPPARPKAVTYEFYAKLGGEPPEMACNCSAVSRLRLPGMFCGLERLLGKAEGGCLGHIKYVFNGSVAITEDYQPKKNAREISALGFFLELVATHDLLKMWADKISTTLSPGHHRILQLKCACLPICQETAGRIWELGISRAIRRRAEKLRRLAGMKRAS